MLQRAKAQGFVHSITNLYDDSFAGPTAAAAAANASASYHQQPICVDPTGLPYMEGDYWVGEAENILKEMVSVSSQFVHIFYIKMFIAQLISVGPQWYLLHWQQ
jgi:hypothetical protein